MRALLAVVGLLVVAGCIGPAGVDTGTEPADDTPTATPTDTPYPDRLVQFPGGPKDRPAVPGTLTADSAAAFAVTHEYRYSYNDLWEGPGTEVGMSAENSCSARSTAAAGDGYVVVVRCTGYVNVPDDDPDSTATVHYDLPPWTVRYYVDADSVLRTEMD